MGLYQVNFEGGHTLIVNAPDEAAARAHVDNDRVRDPFLGQAAPAVLSRPQIPQRAAVVNVEPLDKWTYRRLRELEAEDASRQSELTALRAEAAVADARRPQPPTR